MKTRLPAHITMWVDTEEKKGPLEFTPTLRWWSPDRVCHLLHVETARRRLRTGDYAISGYEHVTLCERKGSFSELTKNLFTADRGRFIRAFDRLADECLYPVLLLDMPRTCRTGRYVRNPEQVVDMIMREAILRHISVVWVPPSTQATRAGDLLLRYMWQCIWDHMTYRPTRRGGTSNATSKDPRTSAKKPAKTCRTARTPSI